MSKMVQKTNYIIDLKSFLSYYLMFYKFDPPLQPSPLYSHFDYKNYFIQLA